MKARDPAHLTTKTLVCSHLTAEHHSEDSTSSTRCIQDTVLSCGNSSLSAVCLMHQTCKILAVSPPAMGLRRRTWNSYKWWKHPEIDLCLLKAFLVANAHYQFLPNCNLDKVPGQEISSQWRWRKCREEVGSDTVNFFPLRILSLAVGVSSLKSTGVQHRSLQTCPRCVLSCLWWSWKKLVHLFQL